MRISDTLSLDSVPRAEFPLKPLEVQQCILHQYQNTALLVNAADLPQIRNIFEVWFCKAFSTEQG